MTDIEQDWLVHSGMLGQHYCDVRNKEWFFCNWMPQRHDTSLSRSCAAQNLRFARESEKRARCTNSLTFEDLLKTKIAECCVALACGDLQYAKHSLYESAVVCLRAIDVIAGRQKLGMPDNTQGDATCKRQ